VLCGVVQCKGKKKNGERNSLDKMHSTEEKSERVKMKSGMGERVEMLFGMSRKHRGGEKAEESPIMMGGWPGYRNRQRPAPTGGHETGWGGRRPV